MVFVARFLDSARFRAIAPGFNCRAHAWYSEAGLIVPRTIVPIHISPRLVTTLIIMLTRPLCGASLIVSNLVDLIRGQRLRLVVAPILQRALESPNPGSLKAIVNKGPSNTEAHRKHEGLSKVCSVVK